MDDPDTGELSRRLRSLGHRVDGLAAELVATRIHAAAWPAVLLLLACLVVPLYREAETENLSVDETPGEWSTLPGLVGKAGDFGNGAVQGGAVLLIVAILVTAALTAAAALSPNRRTGIALAVAASVALGLWLAVLVVVGAAGGGGSIDELDYRNTIRVLLVPVACAAALFASHVVRDAAG